MCCLLLQNYETMKYSDWKLLTKEEKQQVKFKHHPHVRIATLFSVLFVLLLLVFVFRVLKNRTIHVVRKPTPEEAFFMAKEFVKDKLKMPATADFASQKQVKADTARDRYQVTSQVNVQDVNGKPTKVNWNIMLSYTGGDWADQQSWKIMNLQMDPALK